MSRYLIMIVAVLASLLSSGQETYFPQGSPDRYNGWTLRIVNLPEAVSIPEMLLDSYSETNLNAGTSICSPCGLSTYLGGSFTPDQNAKLSSIKLYLLANDYPVPTDNDFSVYVYAHTGTYGSTGKPTGSPLATSVLIDHEVLSTEVYQLITATFTGANQIDLVSGTHYFIVIFYPVNTTSLYVGLDSEAPTFDGNTALSSNGTSWTSYTSMDLLFYVYGQ